MMPYPFKYQTHTIPNSHHAAVIKILLTTFQILTSIPGTFSTIYPAAFAKFLTWMSLVSSE